MGIIKYKGLASQRSAKAGFALLVAVIFISVVLSLGVALSSLGYKQLILASGGTRSQYAFYAADAALECALVSVGMEYNDDPFSYVNHGSAKLPGCSGLVYQPRFTELCYELGSCPNQRITRQTFPIAYSDPMSKQPDTEALCAEVTVYEEKDKPGGTTHVFAQGYDVPCAKVGTTNRIVTRGIATHF